MSSSTSTSNSVIFSWIRDVLRESHSSPPLTSDRPDFRALPSAPASQRKRKKESDASEPSEPSVPSVNRQDPTKKPRTAHHETSSPNSMRLPDDLVSLVPSSSARSQTSGRSRSSSPSRVKAELATANPRVIYVHESGDPGSTAAFELLASLTEDTGFDQDTTEAHRIASASCTCATELRSEGSWLNKVSLPLLEQALIELPLECWSVQTESVHPLYQPRYTARDAYSRKIDLVVGLPVQPWEEDYQRAGLGTPDKQFSHILHPHTGKRILGLGIEIKAADGNLIEAQVQLGVWMSGLLMWAFTQRKDGICPPPLVGCTVVGEDWKFYIAVAGNASSGTLEEVKRIWGPLSDLDGHTSSVKQTESLIRKLRRVMTYIVSEYQESIFRSMES
ncbi:uncharacterized protein N7459_006205 [Penicillium hispanicum]|uniref:uncharacterized protein n=1 Tax=Penicillium hispanicum TaxID=1080232 RepID=UPI00253F89B8|nr:uncharacterized protein N7459_006205 [Penicillium hispanicum]KAJ5580220.1 hypothetical protein N7459_006205 [Penicillium hispanicum]